MRAAFEKESGQDLARFFDAWIDGSGTPAVAFSWARAAGGAAPEVALRIEQRGRQSEFPVTVTLHYAGGEAEDRQVVVRERAAEFRLPLKGELRDVTLNRDGLTPLEIVGGRQSQGSGVGSRRLSESGRTGSAERPSPARCWLLLLLNGRPASPNPEPLAPSP